MNQYTNMWQKLLPSLINVGLVLLASAPFLALYGVSWQWKAITISIFFVYSLVVALLNENRCIGMILTSTKWQHKFSLRNKLVYAVLYSLSFATLFIWVLIPFDLLLVNLLLIQLPFILATGTTAHGYLAGRNVTVTTAI